MRPSAVCGQLRAGPEPAEPEAPLVETGIPHRLLLITAVVDRPGGPQCSRRRRRASSQSGSGGLPHPHGGGLSPQGASCHMPWASSGSIGTGGREVIRIAWHRTADVVAVRHRPAASRRRLVSQARRRWVAGVPWRWPRWRALVGVREAGAEGALRPSAHRLCRRARGPSAAGCLPGRLCTRVFRWAIRAGNAATICTGPPRRHRRVGLVAAGMGLTFVLAVAALVVSLVALMRQPTAATPAAAPSNPQVSSKVHTVWPADMGPRWRYPSRTDRRRRRGWLRIYRERRQMLLPRPVASTSRCTRFDDDRLENLRPNNPQGSDANWQCIAGLLAAC